MIPQSYFEITTQMGCKVNCLKYCPQEKILAQYKGNRVMTFEICEKCKGKGVLRREEEISINIPAGIRDGEMIRMSGMGEAVTRGTTGDLYIKINVVPHPVFKREGNDLVMSLNLKLSDALLGTKYPIQTLDGEIEVTIPEGVSINEILREVGVEVKASTNTKNCIILF